MKEPTWRKDEKALFSVRRKLQSGAALTEEEIAVRSAAERTLDYLEVYDATERTNRCAMFRALYLEPKNSRRTLLAIASDVGCDVRSLIRYKKKLLGVYAYIAEKCRQSPLYGVFRVGK